MSFSKNFSLGKQDEISIKPRRAIYKLNLPHVNDRCQLAMTSSFLFPLKVYPGKGYKILMNQNTLCPYHFSCRSLVWGK